MYNVAVCDDEKTVVDVICSMIRQFEMETGERFQIHPFLSADSLLTHYPREIDIIFLDIKMSGIDGMKAAKKIREFDDQVCIIFITSLYQRAYEGYSVRAFGFVKKPFRYVTFRHELLSAIRFIRSIRRKEERITLKREGHLDRIPVAQILYCEVKGHQMGIHFIDGIRTYRISMNELEMILTPYGFLRPHKSFLVSLDAVDRIE